VIAVKILVTAQAADTAAQMYATLEQAPYFAILDLASGTWEFRQNPARKTAHDGIEAVRPILDLGVGAVISGVAGPHAVEALRKQDVVVYRAEGLTVAQAVDACRRGALSRVDGPAASPSAAMPVHRP